jgi:hypothetical protein
VPRGPRKPQDRSETDAALAIDQALAEARRQFAQAFSAAVAGSLRAEDEMRSALALIDRARVQVARTFEHEAL